MSDAKETLDQLRSSIAAIDGEIIALMKKRLSTALRIGQMKSELKLPVKDYRVEKNVFDRNKKKAKEIGLFEEMANDTSRLLIKYAVFAQDKLRQKVQLQKTRDMKKILVIGGHGQMGMWLANYFDSLGHMVKISDSKGPPSGLNRQEFETVDFENTNLDSFNAIVIATPISQTASVIETLISTKTNSLIFDVCSLKSPIIESIKLAKKSGLRITSVHPMFGPDADILSGKNIIFCNTGDEKLSTESQTYFSETSARLISMPIEDHDKAMGYVLGLSHLSNLVFADALSVSGFEYGQLDEIASSTFQAQIQVVRPVTEENQALYYEIQASNEYTEEIIEGFKKSLDRFSKVIDSNDREGFEALMEKCRCYFNTPINN